MKKAATKKRTKKFNVHSFVKAKLRAASLSNPAKNERKKRQKVAAATFECEHCKAWAYEGKSEKNFEQLKKDNPSKVFKQEKLQADHINCVREGKGEWDWNDYIESLFCDVEGYQMLCDDCHKTKTEKDRTKLKK